MKKIRQITYYLWGIAIALTLSNSLMAQVTIGSGIEPIKGALLDLKENNPNITDNTNASRGLLLPRVLLSKVNMLYPMFEDKNSPGQPNSDYSSVTQQKELNDMHTGLTVYNLTDNGILCPGIYVWSGTLWERIPKPCTPLIRKVENGVTCGTGTVTLTAEASTGAIIRWYDAKENGTLLQTSTTENDTFTTPILTTTTSYWIEAYNPNMTGLEPRMEVVAIVDNVPKTPTTGASTVDVCYNAPGILTATLDPSDIGCDIVWYAADGITELGRGNSYTTPPLTTSISYIARAITPNGCQSPALNINTNIIGPLTISTPTISPIKTTISKTYVTASVTTSAGATVSWYLSDGTHLDDGASIDIDVDCQTDDFVYAVATDCSNVEMASTMVALPMADFSTIRGICEVKYSGSGFSIDSGSHTFHVTFSNLPPGFYLRNGIYEGPIPWTITQTDASTNTWEATVTVAAGVRPWRLNVAVASLNSACATAWWYISPYNGVIQYQSKTKMKSYSVDGVSLPCPDAFTSSYLWLPDLSVGTKQYTVRMTY